MDSLHRKGRIQWLQQCGLHLLTSSSILAALSVGLPHVVTTKTTSRTGIYPPRFVTPAERKYHLAQSFNQVPGWMLPGSCASPEPAPQAWPESCVCSLQLGGVTLTNLVALSRGAVASQSKIKVLLAEEGYREAG